MRKSHEIEDLLLQQNTQKSPIKKMFHLELDDSICNRTFQDSHYYTPKYQYFKAYTEATPENQSLNQTKKFPKLSPIKPFDQILIETDTPDFNTYSNNIFLEQFSKIETRSPTYSDILNSTNELRSPTSFDFNSSAQGKKTKKFNFNNKIYLSPKADNVSKTEPKLTIKELMRLQRENYSPERSPPRSIQSPQRPIGSAKRQKNSPESHREPLNYLTSIKNDKTNPKTLKSNFKAAKTQENSFTSYDTVNFKITRNPKSNDAPNAVHECSTNFTPFSASYGTASKLDQTQTRRKSKRNLSGIRVQTETSNQNNSQQKGFNRSLHIHYSKLKLNALDFEPKSKVPSSSLHQQSAKCLNQQLKQIYSGKFKLFRGRI